MKTTPVVFAAIIGAISNIAFAADEQGKCCDKPKPDPASSCCCCAKKQKQAAEPSLEQLVATAKDAKGEEVLQALAAVINRLIEERRGVPTSPRIDAFPQGHQH